MNEKIKEIESLVEEIVDELQDSSETYTEAIRKAEVLKAEGPLNDVIYSRLHLRMVEEKPTVKDRLRFD